MTAILDEQQARTRVQKVGRWQDAPQLPGGYHPATRLPARSPPMGSETGPIVVFAARDSTCLPFRMPLMLIADVKGLYDEIQNVGLVASVIGPFAKAGVVRVQQQAAQWVPFNVIVWQGGVSWCHGSNDALCCAKGLSVVSG